MTSYIVELEDYKGEHQASGKEGAPLFDLTMNGVYPDDVYSINGLQYYGTGHQDNLDREAFNIIRNSYNKPNKKVKIYRAVPYVKSVEDQLLDVADAKKLWLKRNKVHKSFINLDLPQKYYYDYLDDLEQKLTQQTDSVKKVDTINVGDWVTIVKGYAKDHGESNLKNQYKILSKTVSASQLFTDGNSWLEWGYHP